MYIFSKEKKAIISLKGILKVEKTIGGGKGKKFALTDDLGGVLAFYPEEKNAMDELEKIFQALEEGKETYMIQGELT